MWFHTKLRLLMAAVVAVAVVALGVPEAGAILVLLVVWAIPMLVLGMLRRSRDEPLLRLASGGVDLAASAAAIFILPLLLAPVAISLVLLVTIEILESGLAHGWRIGAIAIVAIAIPAATVDVPHAPLIVAAFAAAVLALPLALERLVGAERRRLADLRRLHEATISLASQPSIEATLEAVASAASRLTDARHVLVLLTPDRPEGDIHGGLWPQCADGSPVGLEVLQEAAEQALRARQPLDVQLTDVSGRAEEPRLLEDAGIRSCTVFPLSEAGDGGALVVGAAQTGGIDPDDKPVVAAFVAAAVLHLGRAWAYETQGFQAAERVAFLAEVGHDLKVPLSTIRGFVETLRVHGDAIDDEGRERMLRIAQRNADELARRIDGMLTFSQVEADVIEVHPVQVDLGQLIPEIAEDCSGLVLDHVLQVRVPAPLPARTDPVALHHIVSNLLGNAAKFSSPGSEIVLEVSGDAGVIQVRVRDHGPGFEDLQRVFERYVRGTTQVGGSGLGLAICRAYVDLLGGSIEASNLDDGAEVVVRLPGAGQWDSSQSSGQASAPKNQSDNR